MHPRLILICFHFLDTSKSSITDGLFDTTLYTDKQLRHYKYELAGYVVSLVSGAAFVEQVTYNLLWLSIIVNMYNR
mgnify:CR=1 FL=1